MRKFSAHRIYPVSSPPIPFGIIETADDGTILDIRSTGGKPVEEAGLEFYPGIIIPGMINAHCHLELSHMAGMIPKKTGLSGFVSVISHIRKSDPEVILKAAAQADRMMYREGISATGDISNTGITLAVKQNSGIFYHTFVEIFGLNREVANVRFKQAADIARAFTEARQPVSLSPHAPYSLSTDLWEMLALTEGITGRISIHLDESPEERELLDHRSGTLYNYFREAGFDLSRLPVEAPDAIRLLGRYLPQSEWLLVHNTMTDPRSTRDYARAGIYRVLCPGSNLYIENLLPDIEGFAAGGHLVCLGTDSLASNNSLSVLEEMKTVLQAAPGIDFEKVLQWATINGARALGMEKQLGTIEKGKKPGLVSIPAFDWTKNRLTAESRSMRLV